MFVAFVVIRPKWQELNWLRRTRRSIRSLVFRNLWSTTKILFYLEQGDLEKELQSLERSSSSKGKVAAVISWLLTGGMMLGTGRDLDLVKQLAMLWLLIFVQQELIIVIASRIVGLSPYLRPLQPRFTWPSFTCRRNSWKRSRSLTASDKCLRNMVLYRIFKAAMIPWSHGWYTDVRFSGRKINLTCEGALTFMCPGALSQNNATWSDPCTFWIWGTKKWSIQYWDKSRVIHALFCAL